MNFQQLREVAQAMGDAERVVFLTAISALADSIKSELDESPNGCRGEASAQVSEVGVNVSVRPAGEVRGVHPTDNQT